MDRVSRPLFAAAALVLVGVLILQVFLAGLGVFEHPRAFATHRDVGYMLSLIAFVVVVLAAASRAPRRILAIAVLALVLTFVQSVLVVLRADYPMVAALHPLNGFFIVALSLIIAREAWVRRRAHRQPDRPFDAHPSPGST